MIRSRHPLRAWLSLRLIAGVDDAEHLVAQRVEIWRHPGAADGLGLRHGCFETACEVEQQALEIGVMGDAAGKCTIGLDGKRSVDQLDVAADGVESRESVGGNRCFNVVCHGVVVRG